MKVDPNIPERMGGYILQKTTWEKDVVVNITKKTHCYGGQFITKPGDGVCSKNFPKVAEDLKKHNEKWAKSSPNPTTEP